jgi:hypothetical protein
VLAFGVIVASGACSLVVDLSVLGGGDASIGDASNDGGGTDAISDVIVHDAIDLDVNTAVCDGGTPIVPDDQAVWTSASIGADNASCGTRAAPCKTIANALVRASAQSVHVIYIDDSTFAESVTLGAAQAALTIQGGWSITDAGWSAVCNDGTSIIQGVSSGPSAAIVVNGANGATLRLLTVRSKTNGAVGESVYALQVVDTPSVTLDNVVLLAQSGGTGAPGVTGTTSGGCTATNAGSGSTGAVGTGGAAGSFGASGYVPAVAGTGLDGGNGTLAAPQAGNCSNNCVTNCTPGGTCQITTGSVCSADGGPGCAGYGGGGGYGGQGGGASIALYASGATTTVLVDGALFSGFGGPGGSGGPGVQGSLGTVGSKGANATCYGSCGGNTCVLSNPVTLNGGAAGVGGNGGSGGQGGGGQGGPIYFYAMANGAQVTLTPATLTASQAKGTPGGGGAPNGVAGGSGAHP